jgi:glyoxylase-like metal-dependent hydrolase (beta-lactamase superfamily II)
VAEAVPVPGFEHILRVRAENPSALTLDGTNTWVAARWAVDPGPADTGHLEEVLRAASGAIEGIALTHGHSDHAEGADELARLAGGVPVVRPAGDGRAGPFEAIATPGHSPDHVCLLLERVCFSGDTVLGAGSVFISPGEGSLGAYLDSLRRLRELGLELICPGHGPPVHEPNERLDAYIAHRLDRERRLLEALATGARSRDELLGRAWDDVPFDEQPMLRHAALLTLEAHLEKLSAEGRLPEGVEGYER